MNQVDALADQVFTAVKSYLDSQIEISDAQIRQFESDAFAKINERIAALEQTRVMRFYGPHDPAVPSYGAGAVVQRSGGVFVALKPTCETPGASAEWRRIASDR